MTAIERLSGAESAARIIGLSKWPAINRCVGANDEPCKFPECHCAETGLVGLPVLDTMTDDRFSLHRVDTDQIGERDGVSVGGCRTDLPIPFAADDDEGLTEFIDGITQSGQRLKRIAKAIGAGLVLGAVIYAFMHK